jgi:flagellar motor switch/type III secretory pathway protein FliN
VSAASAVSPFPWHALERTTASEAFALREVRRWASANADVPRLASALGELLGAEVEVLLQRVQPLTVARGIPGGAGVLVAGADAPQMDRAMLVEADLALVATAVARVARRRPPASMVPGAAASAPATGALGALVVAALRRAHRGRALRVLAAGPATALEADMTRLGQELLAVTLTVLVAHEAYEARVVVPRGAATGAMTSTWGAAALSALAAVPLAMPVVGHVLQATVADIALLGPGDALLLPGWPLARTPRGELAGPVLLATVDGATGFAAELGEDGCLVLRGELVPLGATEAKMGDTADTDALIEAIGEVPVIVRVELGEARMTAREWAAVGRGDVVTLGRRVGESVVVRVGGVAVARGDLVDVDGEVGVRIVERFAAEGARR